MRPRHPLAILACLLLVVAQAGCAARQRKAELALIYNEAAQHHAPDRNPIIAIPGILAASFSRRIGGSARTSPMWRTGGSRDSPHGASKPAARARIGSCAPIRIADWS